MAHGSPAYPKLPDIVAVERRTLGLTGIDVPLVGIAASQPFNVIGKESQTDRARLVHAALDRDIDFFSTSPTHGEAERILAAGLVGVRYRATVMSTIRHPEAAVAFRQIDMSLHLFDGRVDLFMANWHAASDELLASLVRMRSVGETGAIGIECQSLEGLRDVAPRVLSEGLDLVSLPATLLLSTESTGLIDTIIERQCGVIAYIPDGLSMTAGSGLDDMKVNAGGHGLQSVADVLLKLASSDPRISSVAVPIRRLRELDRIEEIAISPAFNPSEMAALRTQ